MVMQFQLCIWTVHWIFPSVLPAAINCLKGAGRESEKLYSIELMVMFVQKSVSWKHHEPEGYSALCLGQHRYFNMHLMILFLTLWIIALWQQYQGETNDVENTGYLNCLVYISFNFLILKYPYFSNLNNFYQNGTKQDCFSKVIFLWPQKDFFASERDERYFRECWEN